MLVSVLLHQSPCFISLAGAVRLEDLVVIDLFRRELYPGTSLEPADVDGIVGEDSLQFTGFVPLEDFSVHVTSRRAFQTVGEKH